MPDQKSGVMIPALAEAGKNTRNVMALMHKISLIGLYTVLIMMTPVYGALSSDWNSDYARFYMANATALPGDTLTVPVILSNTDSVAGFQFNLLPASSGIDIISIESGERIESLHGWSVYSNRLYDGTYKIIGFDLDGVGIGAGDGAIVTLKIVIQNDISHGIFRIDFSHQVLSDNLGNIVPSSVDPGYVSITDKDVIFTCLPDTLSNRDVDKNISILMSNSTDVAGFQFDLVDSADIFQVTAVSNPFGSTWDVDSSEISNGAVRILCSNSSGGLIPENSVNKLVLTVQADSNAQSGTYPVYFENVIVSDSNAQAISVEGIGSTILLDNTLLTLFDLLSPEDGIMLNYSGNMGDTLDFLWEKSRSPDGLPVIYKVYIGASGYGLIPGCFTSDSEGSDTSFTLAIFELVEHLESIGVQSFDSVGVNWYVLADDGKSSRRSQSIFDFGIQISTGIDLLDRTVPEDFSLSQNYPNPFNSITTINYAIPRTVPVKIIVYNILGQEIAVLMNGLQTPGFYTCQWSGRNQQHDQVESGIYLYLIRAGHFSRTAKMILLK
ncbi:MAG: T9SS type A sorting domain-containing protein [Candidatus Marinimicrobia bacterium]|nr:T9SS type A sorting domain-containing protein [Candidatus Neomarinimicrobiota bacterium]